MIQIYGDSITAGVPGVSYCDYLAKNIVFKKYGVGGDTITGLLNRINATEISKKDIYIIEIGTNDIMLPYLRTTSKKWEETVLNIERSGRITTQSISDFIIKYDELLQVLDENNAGVISIPCIGENTTSELNKKVDEYNLELKKLCLKHNKHYIDFNTIQKSEIETIKGSRKINYFINKNHDYMVLDVVLTKFPGLTNYLSNKRKLRTTVDGVHLNISGATLLANIVMNAITKLS